MYYEKFVLVYIQYINYDLQLVQSVIRPYISIILLTTSFLHNFKIYIIFSS